MNDDTRPTLALVFGHFSHVAEMSHWQAVEQFVNPCGMFKRVYVLALGDDRPYPDYEFGSVRLRRIRSLVSHPKFKRINDIVALSLGSLHLWRMVRKLKIDIIAQIDSSPVKFGVPAVLVGQLTGVPSLITLQSDYARVEPTLQLHLRMISRIFWPYILRNCTRVRSVSRPIAEFALSHGVSEEDVEIIPNKEDLASFRDPDPPEEMKKQARELGIKDLIGSSLVFLSVGRLIEVKNLERCLKAFALAYQQRTDLAYLIVGTGELLEDLQQLARSLGVHERVRFLGYFPHDGLARIYHLSDVFLFPTLWEGHPRVVLEAMAARLPIICSNFGAITDLVGPGDGLRVDPTDVDQIASAMRTLAEDAALRRKLGEHPAFDPEEFSIEAINMREAALYSDMLERSNQDSTRNTAASVG